MTLEERLFELFEENDFSYINLFRNPDGSWQCNAGHRATGSYGIGKSKSPDSAIHKALDEAIKARAKIQRIIDGEHLKNLPKKKPSLDDLL